MLRGMRALVIAAVALLGSPAGASFIDSDAKVINCKIVYYGASQPLLHDNLAYVYLQTSKEKKTVGPAVVKGKAAALSPARDDYYEVLPLTLGDIRGYKTQFHLYTVPTSADYNASRLLVLKETDAVVFVASNAPAELPATIASWTQLKRNLTELGYVPGALPIVVQIDRRDRPDALPAAKLREALGLGAEPTFEAVLSTGVGVFETLRATAKLVLMELRKK
jgi:hypothetical protein